MMELNLKNIDLRAASRFFSRQERLGPVRYDDARDW